MKCAEIELFLTTIWKANSTRPAWTNFSTTSSRAPRAAPSSRPTRNKTSIFDLLQARVGTNARHEKPDSGGARRRCGDGAAASRDAMAYARGRRRSLRRSGIRGWSMYRRAVRRATPFWPTRAK